MLQHKFCAFYGSGERFKCYLDAGRGDNENGKLFPLFLSFRHYCFIPDHPLDMLEMRKMKANERNNKSVTGNETKDKENDRQQEH